MVDCGGINLFENGVNGEKGEKECEEIEAGMGSEGVFAERTQKCQKRAPFSENGRRGRFCGTNLAGSGEVRAFYGTNPNRTEAVTVRNA